MKHSFAILLAGLWAIAPAPAQTTVYDSAGFEAFLPAQGLGGQDAPPLGAGPWRQDRGTSTAAVTAANTIEGNQSVRIDRAAGAGGDTRWGVLTAVTPAGADNVVEVRFDMRVQRKANEFGPLFGVEAYDASGGAPKLIGSLLLDASNGEVVCHEPGAGTLAGTGKFLDVVPHHHYRLALNFTAKTVSLYADGRQLHTQGFVDTAATSFTDAPLVTLAADPGRNDAGIAYFDNYQILHTTSALPHLLWVGDGAANEWRVGGSRNWHDGLGPVAFADGAPVRFDDSGSASPDIDVHGEVTPAGVEVFADVDYALRGGGSIAGAGGLEKRGAGTLTLATANTYSGESVIHDGTLALAAAAGSATGTGRVTVQPRATVTGSGNIGGSLWVARGAIVAPGSPGPGSIAVGGQLVLDDAALRFDLGSAGDSLSAAGDVTLGGTLEVTAAEGFGPGSYPLITYGGSLTYGTLRVESAPPGYDYTVDVSADGTVALVVDLPPPPPAAPADLVATAAGAGAIDLSWSDRSDNEDGFVVERARGNGGFEVVASTGADQAAFTDSGLASGTRYAYRVRAVNAGGESSYSNIAAARTDLSPPVAHYEYELNTLDSSGNNHHGAPVGPVLYGEGHVGENAAAFDGASFVEITRVVENSFTVAMWVKTTSNASGGSWYNGMGLVDGEMVGGTSDWGCSVLNSKFAFGVGAPDTTISSNRRINDGAWHHVAATRDAETGTVRIYVDGLLDVTAPAPAGPRTAPTQLRIGASQSNPPVFFSGAIDDLRFYDAVLNEAEIADLGGVPAPPPPPTGELLTIHPLGDSITWGYTTASAADSPGGYREPLYRNLLANGLDAVEFVGANATNPGPLLSRDGHIAHDGYPQYTIGEISANLDGDAPTGKTRGNHGGFWITGGDVRPPIDPDLILLLAGTNDIEGGAVAAAIEARMDAMVGKIFRLRPGATLLLASIPPYPADAAKTATAKAYNQRLADHTVPKYLAAGFDIRFVDQYANFVAASGPQGDVINASLYGDTIHPNEAGYQLMGDTWAEAILAPLPAPPSAPSGLEVVEVSGSGITLAWDDNSDSEAAFVIQRTLDGVHFETIGSAGPDATRFTDTYVGGGRTYGYRVVARNSGGDSAASNYLTVTAEARPVTLHLRFDEAGGGTAFDSSPHGHHGALAGDPVFAAGHVANALDFDGDGDRVELPAGFAEGLRDFTVASWVKLDSLDTWSRVFDFGTGITNYMFLTPRSSTTGTMRFAMVAPGSGGEQGVDGTVAMPVGRWVHVAVTLAGPDATLYLDGEVIGTNPAMTLTPSSLGPTTQNFLGDSQWNNDPYLDGMLDEFEIHDRALGPDEVRALLVERRDPMVIPSAPTGLTATAADGEITLAWGAVDGAATYSVYRSGGAGFALVAAGLVDTAFTDSGLSNGTTYQYAVVASNAAGDSSMSSPLEATPIPAVEYAGWAFVAAFDVAGDDGTIGATGELPAEGGSRETSLHGAAGGGVVAGEVGHAATVGQGGVTRSEASLSDVVIDAGSGILIEADFVMARALAAYQAGGSTGLAAASEIGTLTVAGVPVTITGESNQAIDFGAGQLVIDEQIPTGTSITVHALRVTLYGGGEIIIAGAHAGLDSLEEPPPGLDDRVTGGGWIADDSGGRIGNFGVGGGYKGDVLSGHLTYRDTATKMKVKATRITYYGRGTTPESRRIEGEAEIDGEPGMAFVVVVEDNGEPGDRDTFSIWLSNGYAAGGVLGGGNIQLHPAGE